MRRRSGDQLVMRMELELVEALCGFQKVIRTLDERDLVITCLPGEVIKHEAIKCILNEGMPQYRNPCEKGRLLVKFFVNFPKYIDVGVIPELEKYLPARYFIGFVSNLCCPNVSSLCLFITGRKHLSLTKPKRWF